MDLILWRHAEAELLDFELGPKRDNDRALTPKGRKQAVKMAFWLDSLLPQGCKILVSPSIRTRQTAMALGRKFTISEDLDTNSKAARVLAACNWPHSREPVLIIGHQPYLGDIVTELVDSIGPNCGIRKGNVWWISQKQREDGDTSFLKAIMSPELVLK
jgi:phosphohistidine phosphatase